MKRKETNQPIKGRTKNSQPTTLNNEIPMGPGAIITPPHESTNLKVKHLKSASNIINGLDCIFSFFERPIIKHAHLA